MRIITARFATTHVDRHGDRMLLSALESLVESASSQHLPVIHNHDPRTPPIGRIAGARIVSLDGGEYAVDGEIELFEAGDQFEEPLELRSIPVRTYPAGKLQLGFDRNYRNEADQRLIDDISAVLGTHPRSEEKKALDPLSILTIVGLFILSNIASEFLRRLGSDGYDLFKQKLKTLMSLRKEGEKERLLRFDFAVQRGEYIASVEVIMTNPSERDIEMFLSRGLEELDGMLPQIYREDLGIKRITFEYEGGKLVLRFAVRHDCVPLFPDSSL